MNGVSVRVVGTKIVVEVDILKAIAEGVGGARLRPTRGKEGCYARRPNRIDVPAKQHNVPG
jgi:hypothetical protein